MNRARRSVLAISVASLVSLCMAVGGTAFAAAAGHGVKGDPQPELKPFEIGNASSAGTAAMESNGAIVVVYDIDNDTKTFVCVLGRGDRRCSSTVTLTPPDGIGTGGTPQVFAPSPGHVVVLQAACCDSNANDDTLFYTSTNGGRTFGPPVGVGGLLGVDTAALVGPDVVFSAGDDGAGAQVQSIDVAAPAPSGSVATATHHTAYFIADASYHGGALIASNFLGTSSDTTYVAYASAGHNFGASGSYHNVGTFNGEQLLGISGGALLTIQDSGTRSSVLLRLFNGTRFGPAHVVPGRNHPGPAAFGIGQDPSGAVHVFADRAAAYNLIEVSTSNGTRWSGQVDLGYAISSTSFSAALDSRGSGLVLGTAPAWGYPVLAAQGITLRLKLSRIRRGHSTTGSGRGFPAAKGRLVSLQVQRRGLWFTIATTHEGTGGSYSFKIKGAVLGTHRYRAVVSDLAGYLQFGYSNGHSLRVVS
jgi:hypothetical protein